MGTNDDRSILWLIVVALMCALMLGMCVSLCAVEADAVEPVTIVIRDFGKGMTPALPPYRNAPEDIVLSQNFLSTSPGGRQLRFGYARLDTADAPDDAIQSIAMFRPTRDSSHVVTTAGGSWLTTVGAVRTWQSGRRGETWKDTLALSTVIRPYNGCDSVIFDDDSVVGFGTRFIRDLQAGDVFHGTDTVKYIVSDTKLKLTAATGNAGTAFSFNPSRSYPTNGSDPFLLQSGDYLYTGALGSNPQIIYAHEDTLRIRPMGIVDSFYIDTIYAQYPPTVGGFDDPDSIAKYGGRRSWDTTVAGSHFLKEIQLVSRRKPGQWTTDKWLEDIGENPEAYYVRVGYEDKTSFYQIAGNTDTSIYLMTWYVDTTEVDTGSAPMDDSLWNDSLFFGKGADLNDIPSAATVEGAWGYIYSSAGFYRTVVDDETTDTVKIRGRGAMFWAITGDVTVTDTAKRAGATYIISPALSDRTIYGAPRYPDGYWVGAICSVFTGDATDSVFTVTGYDNGDIWSYYTGEGPIDSLSFAAFGETVAAGDSFKVVHLGPGSFPVDSTEIYKGMHFIHLTGDDIDFPAYIDEASKLLGQYISHGDVSDPIVQSDLPEGDTIRSSRPVWECRFRYYDTYREALDKCGGWMGGEVTPMIEYTITTTRTDRLTKEAQAIGNSFFPIRYMSESADTIFFITAVGTDLTDATDIATVNWEIVVVGMPHFTGMTEWNSPPQLVGWGDSASQGLLSFSGVNDPWNWSVTNDVLVGNNPSSPIISVVGYDDQLVIFKPSSMLGFDGRTFKELSMTDGLVGPKAVVGLTKELYWRDIDGIKKMQRRDFSGYSIQKISQAMDPVFNSWNAIQFGSDVVPISLDDTLRHQTVMTHNLRDNHLYVFTDQTGLFTYDIERGIWDGYHTIAATDAIWTTINDTSRIIFGGPDSAAVFAMDYAWNDASDAITGILRGAKFFITDQSGFPVQSKFLQGWFLSRSGSGMLDSARVALYGENATDVMNLSYSGTIGFKRDIFYSSKDNKSTFWYWEIKAAGDSIVSVFQPHELVLQFLPVTKDDE